MANVGCQDSKLRKICDDMFSSWRTESRHRIFMDFISNERNLILKEYEFGFDERDEIPIAVAEHSNSESAVYNLGENLFRPITAIWGEGEDARDVLQQAIDWWQNQLDLFDSLVAKDPPELR